MISSRPVMSRPVLWRDARFRASAARAYTHLASLPWLVWLIPLWTKIDRNSSFSMFRLSEIPQIPVTRNRLSHNSRPCPCWTLPYSSGSCPFWALPYGRTALCAAGLRPAVVPLDFDQHAPSGVLQKRLAFLYRLQNSDSHPFHLRSLELHVSRSFRGLPGLSGTRPQTPLVYS